MRIRSVLFFIFNFSNLLRVLAIFVVGGLLSACQTSTMSLEEAKKITADFSGSFVPPPRTISDITSRFSASDFDTTVCKYHTEFNEPAHYKRLDAMSPDTLGRFHRVNTSTAAALSQFYKGNFPLSVRLMARALRDVPQGLNLSGYEAQLATYLAYAGDFGEAGSVLSSAENEFAEIMNWKGSKLNFERLKFYLMEGQAAVAGSRGDLLESEALYHQALDTDHWFRDRTGYARLSLARNLIAQRRLLEAENIVRETLKAHQSSGTSIIALAMRQFGEILYEQGRYQDAENIADISIRLYAAICASPENLQVAAAKGLHARSLVALGKWHDAVARYDNIRQSMLKDADTYERLYAGSLYRAIAYLRAGRIDEAEQGLSRALNRTRDRLGKGHYDTAEIEGFLAMVSIARGKQEEAIAGFRKATRVLTAPAGDNSGEGQASRARERRLNLILQAYVGLLSDIRDTALPEKLGIDIASEAFRLTGASQSRSLQRALAAGTARSNLSDPELAGIVRAEQDTKNRISAVLGEISQEESRTDRDSARLSALKSSVENLRDARKALVSEIESRFPEYGALINPQPPTIPDIQKVLINGEVLISTFVGDRKTYVWAVPKSGPVGFAAVNAGRASLQDQIDHLRQALDPGAIATLGDIPAFDIQRAHMLYEQLLKPLESVWKSAKTISYIGHGPLGQLPLSLLVTAPVKPFGNEKTLFAEYRGVPFLARTHAVTVLPSISALKALRRSKVAATRRRPFVGFGDPYFNHAQAMDAAREVEAEVAGIGNVRGIPVTLRSKPQTRSVNSAVLALLPRLPATGFELNSIATNMGADPKTSVFLGKRANEKRVKEMKLDNIRVLAFATHGLVAGDLNGLDQPALALSAPKVAGVDGDGLLTMSEVLGLKLNADWVVLSACNTASADGAGAEAVSGLGRAFFYAGARSLLVSNWPVHSGATAKLTTTLFYLQAKDPTLGRAEALQQTRLEMIDNGLQKDLNGHPLFSYAHPIFWAPFTIVGDGGGADAKS